jgi:hypothetical protein
MALATFFLLIPPRVPKKEIQYHRAWQGPSCIHGPSGIPYTPRQVHLVSSNDERQANFDQHYWYAYTKFRLPARREDEVSAHLSSQPTTDLLEPAGASLRRHRTTDVTNRLSEKVCCSHPHIFTFRMPSSLNSIRTTRQTQSQVPLTPDPENESRTTQTTYSTTEATRQAYAMMEHPGTSSSRGRERNQQASTTHVPVMKWTRQENLYMMRTLGIGRRTC